MNEHWNRRHFLKQTCAAGAGIAATTTVSLLARDGGRDEPLAVQNTGHIRDFSSGLEREEPTLVIGKGDPAAATRSAINALGGMKRFVHPRETVVIKPNVGWDRVPMQAANTNPLVVATLVTLCFEVGAKRVVVTDNSCNDTRRCFTRSGIWKTVEAAGGEVQLPAPHRFIPYELGGTILGRMPVLVPAVRADRFINVPIAKHHGLSGFTGAMKNLYGVLGGRRNRLHQKIDDSIVDLAHFLRATLTVMDATRVLMRSGPQGGNIDDTMAVGEVIASTDPVAVDAYSCTLVGQKASDLPYLIQAQHRGLGTADITKITKKEGG
jgi:uncharacterized protein (DUF362 family)